MQIIHARKALTEFNRAQVPCSMVFDTATGRVSTMHLKHARTALILSEGIVEIAFRTPDTDKLLTVKEIHYRCHMAMKSKGAR